MAFVFTVKLHNFNPSIMEDGSSFAIVADIGCDEAKGTDYKIVVGLEPVPGSSAKEYFFHVLEVERGTGEMHPYWSGKDTRFIRGEDRKRVMTVVGAATAMLIETASPDVVDRVTHDGGLLEPALDKHRFIQEVFEKYGYAVTKSGEQFGNRYWRMERL